MIKAVIFDLDGVIVNTDKYHYLAWKTLADKLHIPFDEKTNDRCRGVSRMESLEILLENSNQNYSNKEKNAFAKYKNNLYREYLNKMTEADVSGQVRETLEKIKKKGIQIAIGSSSKNAKLILKKTGIMQLFDAVSDGENIFHSKPDPEVFLKASEYLNIEADKCMIVEDALSGIIAGKKAGMKTVAYGQNCSQFGADYCIREFEDLLKLLEV